MKDIVQILPNCFIVYSQEGFTKLLKHLHCYGANPDNSYDIGQYSNDEKAFFKKYYPQYDIEADKPLLDENGKQIMLTYNCPVQHPIKYPCIISYQDETFEQSQYYFYIKYIPKHLNLDDFVEYDFKEDKI